MRRPLVILLSVTLATSLAPRATHAQVSATTRPTFVLPADSVVLDIIRRRVAEKRSVGIVVGLLEPDGRARVVAYGDPGPGKPPLDGNSVFEIGSITKVFTATVLADMVSRGEVKLDDPVQKYLPATVKLPTRNGKQITLANLAEQNSGLPRLPGNMRPANMANPYADYTVQQMYEFLSSYELPRDPGAQYEYSNLAVGLLGHVLALRAGQSYEAMVRARILEPLRMTHTAITLTPQLQSQLALGHNPAGDIVANWDLPTLAGAGAIRSTALDMLRFLRAYLHTATASQPLGAAMALAQRERAPTTIPNMGIGLNWHVRHAGADTIVWHNGGTAGYRSFAGFVPSKGIAVVILTNSGGAGADDLGFHLLSPSLALTPARVGQ
ncbi:MAG TPA: serine hydrolase domain-containing protein [Longimicrobiales bacterium]